MNLLQLEGGTRVGQGRREASSGVRKGEDRVLFTPPNMDVGSPGHLTAPHGVGRDSTAPDRVDGPGRGVTRQLRAAGGLCAK